MTNQANIDNIITRDDTTRVLPAGSKPPAVSLRHIIKTKRKNELRKERKRDKKELRPINVKTDCAI